GWSRASPTRRFSPFCRSGAGAATHRVGAAMAASFSKVAAPAPLLHCVAAPAPLLQWGDAPAAPTTPRRPRGPALRAIDARTRPARWLDAGPRDRPGGRPQQRAPRAVPRPARSLQGAGARARPAIEEGLPADVRARRGRP